MITMLAEPVREICEVHGGLTEPKGYTPHSNICLACALEDKEQGHRRTLSLINPRYAVRFRPFEPS